LATASNDGTAQLWKWTENGVEKLMSIRVPSRRPVLSVQFSPNGRELAMLVSNETAVQVWHLDRLHERLEKMGLGW
jgi:WD40 repeat protein